MTLSQIKETVEATANSALGMDTELTKVIPALCNIGLVAVRPSKTGVRLYITVIEEADQTISAMHKIKIVHGLTEYSSIDVQTGEVAEVIEGDLPARKVKGSATFSASTIAKLCQSHVVAIRPSKTGVRQYSQSRDTENNNTLKERFLLDGTHDEYTYDQDGNEIDFNIIYAPHGIDELH